MRMGLEHCLLLIRHGQTELNVQDRMATTTDVALTQRGLEQAQDARPALAGAMFDRAFSPRQRAKVTAQAALADATLRQPLTLDDRLLEPAAGPFEGMRSPTSSAAPTRRCARHTPGRST